MVAMSMPAFNILTAISLLAICCGTKDTATLGMRMPHVFVAVRVSFALKYITYRCEMERL